MGAMSCATADSITPVVTVVLAVVAICVSLWLAAAQRALQERQLRQHSFDKYYEFLEEVEVFLAYIMKSNGVLNLQAEECQRFWRMTGKAEFLFNKDVQKYLDEVKQIVLKLNTNQLRQKHLRDMQQPHDEVTAEINRLLMEVAAMYPDKPKEVFRPYLQLNPTKKLGKNSRS